MRWISLLAFLAMHYTEMAFGMSDGELKDLRDKIKAKGGDCHKSGTLDAIQFLLTTTAATDKTDRDKLKAFLELQDYMNQPGSLYFIDGQDKYVTLECGGKWTVESADPKYNKDFGTKEEDRFATTPGYHVAFKKFVCKKKDCSHIVYAFTRPAPIVFNVATGHETPFAFHEDQKIRINCKINPCLYDSKKCSKPFRSYKESPITADPYTLEWVFAKGGKEKYDLHNLQRKAYNESSTDIPLKIQIASKTLEGKFPVKTTGKNLSAIESTIENPKIETTLTIAKATGDHDGIYECLVTNDYGVVSTPESGKQGLNSDVRYKGQAYVHVRLTMWTWIALGLCIGLIVLALFMNFACPTCKGSADDSSSEKEEAKESPQATAASETENAS